MTTTQNLARALKQLVVPGLAIAGIGSRPELGHSDARSAPQRAIGYWRRCLLFAVVGVAVLAGSATAASAAPVKIDGTFYNHLYGVACPSTSQCTAVDFDGNEVTFNPNSPGSPTPTKIDTYTLNAVACPSTSQCTAIDHSGNEVTFDPTSPGRPTLMTIDSGNDLYSVACPSTSQCTAVDYGGNEVTFNPTSPGSPTPTTIDSPGGLYSVACPSTSQCTAGDEGQNQVTFNPTSPGSPTPTRVGGPWEADDQVACPSTSQCTAVSRGYRVTFNPNAPGTRTAATIDIDSFFEGVACPSTSQCTAVDDGGNQVTFNPTSPGGHTPMLIDNTPGLGAHSLDGVACPSMSQCTAVDDSGHEVTFDPIGASKRRSCGTERVPPGTSGPPKTGSTFGPGIPYKIIVRRGAVSCRKARSLIEATGEGKGTWHEAPDIAAIYTSFPGGWRCAGATGGGYGCVRGRRVGSSGYTDEVDGIQL